MVTPEGVVVLRPTTRINQRQHSMDTKCDSKVLVEACKIRASLEAPSPVNLSPCKDFTVTPHFQNMHPPFLVSSFCVCLAGDKRCMTNFTFHALQEVLRQFPAP